MNAHEAELMRKSGQILARVFSEIRDFVEPGCTGHDISDLVRRETKALGGKTVLLGYEGFPDVICISINDAIVHGIPDDNPFKKGDLVGFDYCVGYDGFITDSAFTMAVGGESTGKAMKLLEMTEKSLYAGIAAVKDGAHIGDISAAIQAVLDKDGYGIVRDLGGHGVGHYVHEDPFIPNYGDAGTGDILKEGMTIAIEPMATLGTHKVFLDRDQWTFRTRDGSLAAQFEHTVLVTKKGSEILTKT
ncbi:MAG TPA: type I methionyl aminopeptidase [Candidatus Saccharimonadales bacterium]|nr:type I methionyl aminopeptidase [Candidatus Saccharimonadales bacterium]